VKFGPGAALRRPDDIPPPPKELGGHGEAKTAGCSNEKDGTDRIT